MKKTLLILCCIGLSTNLFSQDLEDILNDETEETTDIVRGTFKGTRVMNGHSVETREKGVLDFIIAHRFGRINGGIDEFFGLDDSNIRFGLEYSITNDLVVAIGRSSFEKTYDGYVKYALLHQTEGVKKFPISLTLFTSATEKTLKDYDPEEKPTFENRLTYTSQVLIARKFSPNFSLQIMPTYIHFNTVPNTADPNNMFAMGVGTRVKVSNRISLSGEYYYNFNPMESIDSTNSLALGVGIETGGHVFQLIFTNSRSMLEKGFIAETTGEFFNGDIHFGFNISRAFHIGHKKEEKLY
ncbi:MAG: DUF5777 family beta-barrel protein [Flavobacteriaceae bacterium]